MPYTCRFYAAAPLLTITRRPGMPIREMVLLVLVGAAVGGLQVRHSLAASRGVRPIGWQWTYCALLVLAYLPVWWFTLDWAGEIQWFVLASSVMLLPRRPAIIMVAAPIIGTTVYFVHINLSTSTSVQIILWSLYIDAVLLIGGARRCMARPGWSESSKTFTPPAPRWLNKLLLGSGSECPRLARPPWP